MLEIAQCNNALVFPGIGLGILAVNSSRLTKKMIVAAAETLAQWATSKNTASSPCYLP